MEKFIATKRDVAMRPLSSYSKYFFFVAFAKYYKLAIFDESLKLEVLHLL